MAVRKDKRKGWMIDFVHNEKRIRKRSPVQSRMGAEAHERKIRDQLDKPKEQQEEPLKKRGKEVLTFNVFADEFLETYARSNYKPSVQSDTESILRLHLRPRLGRLCLDRIGTREAERLKADLLTRGYSKKTVNNILAVLSTILAYAVDVEVLHEKPRIKVLKIGPQKFDFLDSDEYDRLLSVLKTEPMWGSAIMAAGEGGLRLGEILGMHQEDVDHVAGVITVRRSMWRSHEVSPKSGRDRKVPMTQRLAAALKAERHLKGRHVWSDPSGKPLTKKMAERALQRACRRAGLRCIGWHVLRHTFCSQLAMLGAAPTAIQELAGHKHISTTMRYMHLAPSHLREAVRLLDRGKSGSEYLEHGTLVAPRGE